MAMVCAVSSYAYEVGDYIYTNTAKYKVTGANQVSNGNFATDEGWTGDVADLNTAIWGIETGQGPAGENVLTAVAVPDASEDNKAVVNSWQLEGGLYVVSFWIKGVENTTTTLTVNPSAAGTTYGSNYIDLFLNENGMLVRSSEAKEAATTMSYADEWKEITQTVLVESGETLVFSAANLVSGTMLTRFSINAVKEVYDTRNIDRLTDFATKLLNEPDLSKGKSEFADVLEMMKQMASDPATNEDADNMEGLIAQFNDAFDAFMNQNGGNTIATTGDWTQIASTGFRNLKSFGAWIFDGGRWGFSANDGNLGLPENDGYAAGAGIQTQWAQVWPAYIQSATLPKGQKYFFSIEAKVIPGSSTQIGDTPPYGEDYNTPTLGGENYKMFIGTDTLSMEGDTLSGYYWKKYYMISEIPADADAVRAGWIYTFPVGFAKAARAYLRNPEFRLIGKTELEINYEAAVKNVMVQQEELAKRLAEYPGDVAECKWAKDSLDRAIASAQPVLDASYAFVNFDGTSTIALSQDGIDQLNELSAALLEEVNAMGRAKNYVIAQNTIFGDVENAIAAAQAVLNDALYQDGDKGTLSGTIALAQGALTLIKGTTSDASRENDEAALQNTIGLLADAVEAFKLSANLQPVVDIDFANGFTAVDGAEDTYIALGNVGQMNFEQGKVSEDNTADATLYMLGVGEELLDVLHVGGSNATVILPVAGDDEVIRVSFDLWVGNLVKRYIIVELQNEAGERVAGFRLNRYDGVVDYNDFNNEENAGLDLLNYISAVGRSGVDNAQICVDSNKSSFDLLVDYKQQTVQGMVTNGTNGTCNGQPMPIPSVSDTKVAQFVLSSTYDNKDRRCWFDNLKAYKYKSVEASGISTVGADRLNGTAAIYNLNGMKVQGKLQKGLYIQNGKKYIVK